MICLFFFFSSRRRHTRYIGDWSSDVCSSDLLRGVSGGKQIRQQLRIEKRQQDERINRAFARRKHLHSQCQPAVVPCRFQSPTRSEERRVGKEGRPGGAWCHQQESDIV